jgi:hypothetical protein
MFIVSARERWSERLPADTDQLFDWCLGQDSEILRDLLAFCVAQTVNGVLVKGDWTAPARFAHAARLHEALKAGHDRVVYANGCQLLGKDQQDSHLPGAREDKWRSRIGGKAMKKSDLALVPPGRHSCRPSAYPNDMNERSAMQIQRAERFEDNICRICKLSSLAFSGAAFSDAVFSSRIRNGLRKRASPR